MFPNFRRVVPLVMALVLVGLTHSAEAAPRLWPDTTDGVHVFSDQLVSPLTPELTQFCATHYAGCHTMTRSDANSLRAHNPNFLVLHCRYGLGLGYRDPDRYGEPTDAYLTVIEGDNWVQEWPDDPRDEWFYLYNGAPVYNNMWGWMLIDPDNPSWQAYWLGEVHRQLAANDSDGLFADSTNVPNYLDPTFFTPELPYYDQGFEAEWSARIGRWQNWVKAGIGQDYKLITNVEFWWVDRDATDYSGSDGIWLEAFAAWGQTDPYEPATWSQQMDRVLNLISQDKIVVLQTYIDRPDEIEWRMSILANYLLVKGRKTYLNMDMGIDPEWFPEYEVKIGSFISRAPGSVDELYRSDWQVYAREYTRGLVLVNPTEVARSIDVGPGYELVTPNGGGLVPEDGDISERSLSYSPTQQVTLEPFCGIVLLKPGTLQVTPATGLASSGSQGGPFEPSSIDFTLINTGGVPLEWAASHAGAVNWLSLPPSSGTLAGGASAKVTVSINSNASDLLPGPHTDTITFANTTNGGGNTTRSVELVVLATQAGEMLVTPTTDFLISGPVGGLFDPSQQVYMVSNTGLFPLDFTVHHGYSDSWLSLVQTLPAQGSRIMTASLTELASALGPGVYQEPIFFRNLTNHLGDTSRMAGLTVVSAGISVSPDDGLVSAGKAGGSFSPPSKTYTLTNTGGSPVNWTASHGPSADWVSLSAASGVLAGGQSTSVTVTINSAANALAGGGYSDTVTFTNASTGTGSTTRPISLTVYQGVLEVTPSEGFVSSGPLGGPFNPPSRQYTLRNTGNAALNWTATHSASTDWLRLSEASGSLLPGQASVVTVSINPQAQALAGGEYTDAVSFTTDGAGNTFRPVRLSVITKTLTSVVVSPTSLICPSNDPRQLHATAYFSDSTSLDITSTGLWTPSKPSICTVEASGTIQPKASGAASIACSYTYGGVTKSASCALTVSYQTIWYLYVSPTGITFYNLAPKQLMCQARTTTGWIDVTQVARWTSSNPAVATVDRRGMVTPISDGAAQITVRYAFSGADKTSVVAVVVHTD